jgi:hypothetical protein
MERIAVETPLLIWTSTETQARAGMIRITGAPADAIRIAALTGQWLDRRKSRKSATALAHIGNTSWKNSLFPQEDGAWIMPINQRIRESENLQEGELIKLVLEL